MLTIGPSKNPSTVLFTNFPIPVIAIATGVCYPTSAGLLNVYPRSIIARKNSPVALCIVSKLSIVLLTIRLGHHPFAGSFIIFPILVIAFTIGISH